jgi:hypothetical protein
VKGRIGLSDANEEVLWIERIQAIAIGCHAIQANQLTFDFLLVVHAIPHY